jgi:pyruvate kinase
MNKQMRRTKIVATIGPVSKNESVLQDLLQYADLVRINFSHADHHPQAAEMIRKIAKSLNRTIG